VIRIGIALIILIALAAPAHAQVSQQDIADARERRTAVARELVGATADYETAVAVEISIREGVQSIASELALKERELAMLRAEATEIVRNMYMAAGNTQLVGLFDATVFTDIPMRATYADLANERDVQLLSRLEAIEVAYLDQQRDLDESLISQEALVVEITRIAADIEQRLIDADAEYRTVVELWEHQEAERLRREEEARLRREEEERLRREAAAAAAITTTTSTTTPAGGVTATTTPTTTMPTTTTTTTAPSSSTTTTTPPPPTTGGRTCPVDGAVSFSDSWGAPRSGGRSHKGVDMIAARGTPIVAIESGSVERTSTSSLGGISLYFRGNSGDRYYYAHMDGFADGISGGVTVAVGGLLGSNGSTGNAPDWLPHLHFQWAPAGNDWVNPYPLVAPLCL